MCCSHEKSIWTNAMDPNIAIYQDYKSTKRGLHCIFLSDNFDQLRNARRRLILDGQNQLWTVHIRLQNLDISIRTYQDDKSPQRSHCIIVSDNFEYIDISFIFQPFQTIHRIRLELIVRYKSIYLLIWLGGNDFQPRREALALHVD